MSSSHIHALDLIDTVSHVLRQVDSRGTLFACARVSKLWSFEALKLLWRGKLKRGKPETPSVQALAYIMDMSSIDRLCWYLSFTRHLYIWQDYDLPNEESRIQRLFDFDNRVFTTAKPLSVTVNISQVLMNDGNMVQLLHANLRRLKLEGCSYSNQFLLEIEQRCPLLEALSLADDSRVYKAHPSHRQTGNVIKVSHTTMPTSGNIHRFLRKMPQIIQLELLEGFGHVFSDVVVLHLMSRPKLELLGCEHKLVISRLLLQKAVAEATERIFPDLRCLALDNINMPTLRRSLPLLPRLQHIILKVGYTKGWYGAGVPRLLATCKQLEEVELYLSYNQEPLPDIAQSCPLLRRLTVHTGGCQVESYFMSEDLTTIAKSCPCLEYLHIELNVYRGLIMEDFAAFAVHCPRLSHLCLKMCSELVELSKFPNRPVFACLEVLRVVSATRLYTQHETPPDAESSLEMIALVEEIYTMFKEQMPSLTHFQAWHDVQPRRGTPVEDWSVTGMLRDRVCPQGTKSMFLAPMSVRDKLEQAVFSKASKKDQYCTIS